jgi:hypothetical protein
VIINSSKHGRTKRETAKLAAHLYKVENEYITLAEIGGSAAATLEDVLHDMELLRDGAIPSAAAFHHFPLSPATDRTHEEILEAAHRVRLEFDPDGTRPFAVVVHGKKRAGDATGRTHGHLVLGNFDSNNRALKDKFTKLRTERLAREIEHSWREDSPGSAGEPCGRGRHHVSVLRALRKCSPEVARWLVDTHGEKPAKPQSAISSAGRNRAKRRDVNLPEARFAIQKMWTETLKIGPFRSALSAAGYAIEQGAKPGVWVVRDIKSGTVLGAVDRLLRLKRRDVMNMMETANERRQQESQPGPSTADGRARTKTVRADERNRDVAGPNATIVGADRGKGRGAGERSNSKDGRTADDHRYDAAEAGSAPANPRQKTGFRYRPLDHRRAIQRLRRVDFHRIVALTALYANRRISHDAGEEVPFGPGVDLVDGGKDIWGIPRARPRF